MIFELGHPSKLCMCLHIDTMHPLRINEHKNRHFDNKSYTHASVDNHEANGYEHDKDLLDGLTLIATLRERYADC